jgi:hypothetical protein
MNLTNSIPLMPAGFLALGVGGFMLFLLAAVLVIPALVMWIWNLTMPDVFRLPRITFWQAFRLVVLAGLLLGTLRL